MGRPVLQELVRQKSGWTTGHLLVMHYCCCPHRPVGKIVVCRVAFRREIDNVPFVNPPFESEIHGTVNFTYFCCVLLVTWCHRVLWSGYLRPK